MVIIELKRNESPREVVSQALSYRTYFRKKVTLEKLNKIAEDYFREVSGEGLVIKKKFREKFGVTPTQLNEKQKIVLIAEQFSEDVLSDLEEIPNHVCVEFSY